jgi:4-hydroxy-2-oxovalerate aldolase
MSGAPILPNSYLPDRPCLLDCTLRDGSYTNQFQFSAEDTTRICKVLEEIGLPFIEVGHGVGLGASRLGGEFRAMASDAEYIEAAVKAISKASLGVFCIPDIATLDDLSEAIDLGLGFVRIGTDVTKVETSRPFVELAKRRDIIVCANFMKSYAASPREFAERAEMSADYGTDLVYLVDSAGSMLPGDIRAYAEAAAEVGIPLGFHGHNNLGLAASNSLLCIELGFRLVDVSLQGIGRSSGNAPMELVGLLMDRIGIDHGMDLFAALDAGWNLIRHHLPPSGTNPIDAVCGYAGFHSSFLPLIRSASERYDVDPKKLIIETCKREQVRINDSLVDTIAAEIRMNRGEKPPYSYQMERYTVNEEGLTTKKYS